MGRMKGRGALSTSQLREQTEGVNYCKRADRLTSRVYAVYTLEGQNMENSYVVSTYPDLCKHGQGDLSLLPHLILSRWGNSSSCGPGKKYSM